MTKGVLQGLQTRLKSTSLCLRTAIEVGGRHRSLTVKFTLSLLGPSLGTVRHPFLTTGFSDIVKVRKTGGNGDLGIRFPSIERT